MVTTHFFNRRLHSLLGIIPTGTFLLVHLTVNFMATRGSAAFNNAAEFMANLPFLPVLELVLIFLPLLYHAIYGVFVVFQADYGNIASYGYFRNVMFMLQRITGLITLIFVGWHVWETRIQKFYGTDVDFDLMNDILSSNVGMTFYLIGVISAIFHFSNGMWSFLVSWGITIGPRAQRISSYVWMIVFVALSIVAVLALFAFVNPNNITQATLG